MAKKKIMYQGDLRPDYEATLSSLSDSGVTAPVGELNAAGAVVDVRVIGRLVQGTGNAATTIQLFDRSMSDGDVSVGPGGKVKMEWHPAKLAATAPTTPEDVPGDTDRIGLISTEIEVMWVGMKPQTFRPPELVQVIEDFGGAAPLPPT